jgi:hypothetical protein
MMTPQHTTTNMREILQERIKTPDSSLIDYLVYDHAKEILQVMYKRGKYEGKLKTYKKFSRTAFEQIMQSESKGRELLKILQQLKQEDKSFLNFFRNIFSGKSGEPY